MERKVFKNLPKSGKKAKTEKGKKIRGSVQEVQYPNTRVSKEKKKNLRQEVIYEIKKISLKNIGLQLKRAHFY